MLPVRILLLATLFPHMAAQAQDNATMPHCGPSMDGQVYCKSATMYECQLIDPNSLERRTGWRWKADLLRSCGDPAPADSNQRPNSPPPKIIYVPEQTGHRGTQQDPTVTDGPSAAPGTSDHGTMYIRPGGSVTPGR